MPKVQKLCRGDRLVQQHKFPVDDRTDDEMLIQADHDRLLMWDGDHVEKACLEHMGTGIMGLGHWVGTVAPDRVLALLTDLLQVEQGHPGVKWTGYRISKLVKPGDGYTIFSLWLFARKRGSGTKVSRPERRR